VDRPGLAGGPSAILQWGPKSVHFGQVLFICNADRPGPWGWTVRSPDQRRLLSAQSLNYSANRPALMGGPSAGAKFGLGRDCVVFGICTADCPEDKPGQY
jgi:hypothetical protein